MGNYNRRRVPGGTYFFTVHLQNRNSDLLTTHIDALRNATRTTMRRYPFRIEAITVLPATIHTIWTLPTHDANYANRWSMLKSTFSRRLPDPDHRTRTQITRGEKGIWQHRFWEHMIRDEADFAHHKALVHSAPVAARLVTASTEWPFSSVHRENNPEIPSVIPQFSSQQSVAVSGHAQGFWSLSCGPSTRRVT